MTNASWNWKI